MAEGTYFFTSISSVSIVELPSGGWTLFYDQDIARSPHLPVIITITKAIITAMIVKINPCFCPNLALVLDKKLVDPRLPSPVYACIESLLTTKTAIRNNTMINTIYVVNNACRKLHWLQIHAKEKVILAPILVLYQIDLSKV